LKITHLKICFTLLVLGLVCSTAALAQTQTDKERATEQAIKGLRGREIPEATLPCTPDEANWWNDLRAAGKAVKGFRETRTETDKFVRLVKEGVEKSYQVPVPDRNALVLWKSPPEYTEQARHKQVNGSVALAVELRPDGSVGEVKVAQGLDSGLDQMAVSAARKMVFLPAIKDRKFVSSWMPMTMTFNIYSR